MKKGRTRKGVPWVQPSSSGQSGTVGPGTETLTADEYVLRQEFAKIMGCAKRVNRWLRSGALDKPHGNGNERARLFGQNADTPSGANSDPPVCSYCRWIRWTLAHGTNVERLLRLLALQVTKTPRDAIVLVNRTMFRSSIKHRSGRPQSQCRSTVNGSIHVR